jgi:uncharacterized protein YutE (UPF0331/DUF86 family)
MPFEADHDLVLAKVSTVRTCVATIRGLRAADAPAREAWIVQDVTVLNLQRAAQACLDLANHLIAANRWELPRSARHAFQVLGRNGVVDRALLEVMVGVIGFRNIAVHDYATLNPAVVEAIAGRHLGDLETFADRVVARVFG